MNAITRPRAGRPILNRFGEAVCCHQKVYKFHKSGSVEFWQGVYICVLKSVCVYVCFSVCTCVCMSSMQRKARSELQCPSPIARIPLLHLAKSTKSAGVLQNNRRKNDTFTFTVSYDIIFL